MRSPYLHHAPVGNVVGHLNGLRLVRIARFRSRFRLFLWLLWLRLLWSFTFRHLKLDLHRQCHLHLLAFAFGFCLVRILILRSLGILHVLDVLLSCRIFCREQVSVSILMLRFCSIVPERLATLLWLHVATSLRVTSLDLATSTLIVFPTACRLYVMSSPLRKVSLPTPKSI